MLHNISKDCRVPNDLWTVVCFCSGADWTPRGFNRAGLELGAAGGWWPGAVQSYRNRRVSRGTAHPINSSLACQTVQNKTGIQPLVVIGLLANCSLPLGLVSGWRLDGWLGLGVYRKWYFSRTHRMGEDKLLTSEWARRKKSPVFK